MTDTPDAAEAAPSAQDLFIAGAAALDRYQAHDAADLLRQAALLDPDNPEVALYLARALAMLQRTGEAVAEIERALSLAPDDALALDRAGDLYTLCNLHDRAATVLRRAVQHAPGHAGYRYNLATSLMFHGQLPDAEREYEACIALAPRHWQAHLSLSQLRRQTPDSNHIPRLRALLADPANSTTATVYLNMALAKELEDLDEHAQAFEHLVRGKSAPRALLRYSIRRDEAMFDALARAVPPPSPQVTGNGTSEPIFIVGMPRSGTTLVDRILSSHPQVQSAGELHAFGVAWKEAMGGPSFRMFDPDDIARSRRIDWHRLGSDYLRGTRPLTGHAPHFTDKLPHNFLYLGYIAQALPNAKIVCVRRNPMDTCLGNFRLLFAPESPYFGYSYDLLDTGRYYVLFDRLMAHWKALFPGRIFELDYESVVTEQEHSTRRLLAFCDLPWDEACLHFEHNAAAVATASATQVRAPIYRSALQRWKRYEKPLRPLRALLEQAGIVVTD